MPLFSMPSSQFQTHFTCSPAQSSLFRDYSNRLGNRLMGLSYAQIETQVTSLYQQAYHYEASTGEMFVTNMTVKDRLDLLLTLLQQEAYRHRGFLEEVTLNISNISILNQSSFLPVHRAWQHRLQNNEVHFQDSAFI